MFNAVLYCRLAGMLFIQATSVYISLWFVYAALQDKGVQVKGHPLWRTCQLGDPALAPKTPN